MEKLTLGFYGSTVCMVLIMVPFTIYYYEGEDNDDDGGEGGYDTKRFFASLFKFLDLVLVNLDMP